MNQLRLDPLTGRWVVVSTDRAVRPKAFTPRMAIHPGRHLPTLPLLPRQRGDQLPRRSRRWARWQLAGPGGPQPLSRLRGQRPLRGDQPGSGLHPGHGGRHPRGHRALPRPPELVVDAQRRADHRGDGRHPRSDRGALVDPRAALQPGHRQLPGARRVPPSSTPTASCSACPSSRGSWSRSRPDSPGSPGGACCAPPSMPRRTSDHRVVYADERVLVICPFWSGAPYEMLVIPRAHGAPPPPQPPGRPRGRGQGAEGGPGQPARRGGRRRLQPRLPLGAVSRPEPYHWHVHVVPKITTVAGFELGTGVLINIVNPEQAAEELVVRVPVSRAV